MRFINLYTNLFAILLIFSIFFTFQGYRLTEHGDSDILITAHRGHSGEAPENTIPAIEKAISSGCDYVEIDIWQTKDKELVLLHDAALTRTTGTKGNVWDYTYDELMELDAGSWFGEDFTGTRIPTLEEAFIAVKGSIKINIEIKSSPRHEDIVPQVLDLIKTYNLEKECMISSTEYSYLQQVRELNPDIPTGIILRSSKNLSSYPDADIFCLMFASVSDNVVTQIHNNGKEIFVWTLDDVESIYRAREMGVDSIISNEPDIVSALLNK